MTSIVTKFVKFATKFSGELSTIGTALNMLLANLPIPRAEKADILEAVEGLQTSAENIIAGLKDISETAVKLTAADRKEIAAQVAALLKPDLEKLIADQATAAAVDATAKVLTDRTEPATDPASDKSE